MADRRHIVIDMMHIRTSSRFLLFQLPDKSIASLVKYYYSWKKTRSRTSLMDRQARKLTNSQGDSDEEVMGGSGNSDSDFESPRESMVSLEDACCMVRTGDIFLLTKQVWCKKKARCL